jgi:very-short-patch-repair endonuclease
MNTTERLTVAEFRAIKKPVRSFRYRDKHLNFIRTELDAMKVNHADEYKFHPTRKWKFDIAIHELKIAIEYEGIAGGRSRHTEIVGYTGDCDKYNAAQILGWIVLRFTAKNIKQAREVVIAAINSRG